MQSDAHIVILTKTPVPGSVKTRLIPALGEKGAALLHELMAEETIRRAKSTGLPVTVAVSGSLDDPFVKRLRKQVDTVEAQADGDLGKKLAHALRGTVLLPAPATVAIYCSRRPPMLMAQY